MLKRDLNKDVVSTSDAKYKDFDPSTAVQTYDIIGKHISEFPREETEAVPEIFTLIFNYFEENEKYLQTEGIFRLAGNKETLKEIESK